MRAEVLFLLFTEVVIRVPSSGATTSRRRAPRFRSPPRASSATSSPRRSCRAATRTWSPRRAAPSAAMNPVALNVINMYPLGNVSPSIYVATLVGRNFYDQAGGRIDVDIGVAYGSDEVRAQIDAAW